MIDLELPWPGTALSPNSRVHWAKLAKAKKLYRHMCWALTLDQEARVTSDGPLRLELTFYRPTRRSMDRDNLLARMKSGLDGVCDALKIDDKRFATVVVRVADETGGFVRIHIGEENGSSS